MSLVLGKYEKIKKLGKGSYGDVWLIRDQSKHEYALKQVAKKLIKSDPYLEEYISGEKQCMINVKSKHTTALYGFEEDQDFMYMICEYCNGGDLSIEQAKQRNKVFNLEQSLEILSQVIEGLQGVHSKDFLHRDIKPQNILIHQDNQAGEKMYKLADFGFAKRNHETNGTVLGTSYFMAPEIYEGENYSFEVDMWAFGVLFYFMLNMEYPFRINPHLDLEQRREFLIREATNFSYAERVKSSRKKLEENCKAEVQDIFFRIFQPDPQKRLTFIQIREHKLFRNYFPAILPKSRILYSEKKNLKNRMGHHAKQKAPHEVRNQMPKSPSNNSKPEDIKNYFVQKFNQIAFLSLVAQDVPISGISFPEAHALKYNLRKYEIILLRELLDQLKAKQSVPKFNEYLWYVFEETKDYSDLIKVIQGETRKNQEQFQGDFEYCQDTIEVINDTNQFFQQCMEKTIRETGLEGKFKDSYRESICVIYGKIYQSIKSQKDFTKKLPFLCELTICHAFNHLIKQKEEKKQRILEDFYRDIKKKKNDVEAKDLILWINRVSREKLQKIIQNITSLYFGKKSKTK